MRVPIKLLLGYRRKSAAEGSLGGRGEGDRRGLRHQGVGDARHALQWGHRVYLLLKKFIN